MRHIQDHRTPSTRTRRLSGLRALALLAALCAACHGGGGGGSSASPALASLEPSEGTWRGGTTVRIFGTDLLSRSKPRQVLIQDVADPAIVQVAAVSEWSTTEIVFTTPPGVACERVEFIVQYGSDPDTTRLSVPQPFRYIGPNSRATDVNADDLPDVVVAAPLVGEEGSHTGQVYVFPGQAGGLVDSTASDAGLELRGGAPHDRFGSSLLSADVSGDGVDDLIVCAKLADEAGEQAGSVYVFLGPLPTTGVLEAADANVLLTGAAPGDRFGYAVAAGDVDGDGTADLLVGAPDATAFAGTPDELLDAGAAYLFLGGPALASRGAASADALVHGAERGDALGCALDIADMNADDLGDLLVGAQAASPYGPPRRLNAGAVYLFPGSATPFSGSASDAPVVYAGVETGDAFGFALAHGDVNGDRLEDLIVSAPLSNALGSATGQAYVFLGRNDLSTTVAEAADAIYSGQQGNGGFGRDLAAGDYDDDGYCDVIVGAPRSSFGANSNGRCFLFFGSLQPTDELAHSAGIVLNGEASDSEWFGSALRMIDADCDCRDDLISSAVGNDAAGIDSGRVYTFNGDPTRADRDAPDADVTLTGDSAIGGFGAALATGR